jgi:S-adenosylmethionine uptake transporter
MIDLMWLHQRPKESGWLDVLLLLIGFFGVIFVLHPQSQFYPLWAVLAGLLAGFFASLAYLQIKKLGQIKEPEWRTVLVFSTFVLVTALVLTFSVGEEKLILPVSLSDGMWLFSIGLSGMVAQLFLTRAYSRGSTILTANLQFVTIIFACFFGFLLWDDVIYWWEWLGIVLIVLGGVGATLRAK